MKHLLYKEWRLAMHPTALLFLPLSAMLLIPNYPYYVIFFYTSLGLFFICLTGRENRDIVFSMTLPVSRRAIVRARMMTALFLEAAQLLLSIPFAILRRSLSIPPNAVGMDANLSFFGLSLVLLGLFNLVFFTAYYRAPDRVGTAFVKASAAQGVFILLAETAAHAIPFVRENLDTPDPDQLPAKLILLAAGAVLFGLLTALAYRTAASSFEKLDI